MCIRDSSWTWTDALFWATLGLLVLVNSLWELKRNRKRKLARGSYSPKEAVGVTLRTALTFSLITVLWSLWSTPNLKLWFHIWSLADLNTLAWGCATVACVMAATVLFEIMPVREGGRTEKSMSGLFARTAGLPRDALKCAVALSIILMATYLSARFRRDPSEFHNFPIANGLLQTLADEEAPGQGRGYYENLTSVDEGSGKFWEEMCIRDRSRNDLIHSFWQGGSVSPNQKDCTRAIGISFLDLKPINQQFFLGGHWSQSRPETFVTGWQTNIKS